METPAGASSRAVKQAMQPQGSMCDGLCEPSICLKQYIRDYERQEETYQTRWVTQDRLEQYLDPCLYDHGVVTRSGVHYFHSHPDYHHRTPRRGHFHHYHPDTPSESQEESKLIHKAALASLRDVANGTRGAGRKHAHQAREAGRETKKDAHRDKEDRRKNKSAVQPAIKEGSKFSRPIIVPQNLIFRKKTQTRGPEPPGAFPEDAGESALPEREFDQTQRALYDHGRENSKNLLPEEGISQTQQALYNSFQDSARYQPPKKSQNRPQELVSRATKTKSYERLRPREPSSSNKPQLQEGPPMMSGALGKSVASKAHLGIDKKFEEIADRNAANIRRALTFATSLPLGHLDRASNVIIREMEMLDEFRSDMVTAAPMDPLDAHIWQGTVRGPPMTPYEGGLFTLEIKMTEYYPQEYPSVKVLTKVFHQDINSNGHISPRIFEVWAGNRSVRFLLVEFQRLLREPLDGIPMREDVADLRQKNPKMHDEIAKTYTERYAVQ